MAVDDIVLEPVAKGYNKLSPIRTGTSNFTSNIGHCFYSNNVLQGNFNN